MFVRSILEEAIIVSQYPRTGIQVRVGSRSCINGGLVGT